MSTDTLVSASGAHILRGLGHRYLRAKLETHECVQKACWGEGVVRCNAGSGQVATRSPMGAMLEHLVPAGACSCPTTAPSS